MPVQFKLNGRVLLSLPLVFILCIMFASITEAKRKRLKIKNKIVEAQLLNVINETQKLQKYLYEKKNELVTSQLANLKKTINSAHLTTQKGDFSIQHVSRMLASAKQEIKATQNTSGNMKTTHLKKAFKQIVILYQSYDLKSEYKIFFCDNDRSLWIQMGWKVKNPFNPNSKCGRAMYL